MAHNTEKGARNQTVRIGSKFGHSYSAVILGDDDVADRVYLSSCDSGPAKFRTSEMCKMQCCFISLRLSSSERRIVHKHEHLDVRLARS